MAARIYLVFRALSSRELFRNKPGCLENFSRCSRRHQFKMDPIAEPLNPLGKPIDRIVPSSFVEVMRSQLVILDDQVFCP